MEVKTMLENPIKIIFMLNAVLPVPIPNCAGAEVSLTSGTKFYESCDDEGTSALNGCDEAFSSTQFWQATDSSSIISIFFKVEVFPKKLIFKPDPESAKMPSMITINYDSKHSEKLSIIGNESEWALEKARPTVKLQIEIDKGETGIHLEVFGSPCSYPIEEEKEKQKKEEEKLGVKPVVKVNPADCSKSMDQMSLDETILECKEACPMQVDGVPVFTRDGNNYTRGSKTCGAAMDFFKDKPDELAKKKFGVRKVKNTEKKEENGIIVQFYYTFDQGLLNEIPDFKKGEEVDVLDGENCFGRAVITAVDGKTIKAEISSEEKTFAIDKVFKCGLKLTDPCAFPPTKPIKIKFCRGGGDLDVCKNHVKS